MSKRIFLTDEQAYVLAQMVQDHLNDPPTISHYWPYKKLGDTQLNNLLSKLTAERGRPTLPTVEKETTE